jgi:hypothetical protein
MCDPVSLAVSSFMVSTVSSVMQYNSAQQQANAQDALYNANKANTERSAVYEHQMNDLRKIQEDDKTGAASFDNMLETKAKAAHAEAAASDAGISGLSVDALVQDIYGAGGRTNDRIKENGNMALAQLGAEDQGIEARKDTRINSVQHGVHPSLLALGLNVASNGLNSATAYRKLTK